MVSRLASPSSLIQALDWHSKSANSGGVSYKKPATMQALYNNLSAVARLKGQECSSVPCTSFDGPLTARSHRDSIPPRRLSLVTVGSKTAAYDVSQHPWLPTPSSPSETTSEGDTRSVFTIRN